MYLVDTSGTPDPDSTAFLGIQVKPDISCYLKPAPQGSCVTRAHDMETFIELNNRQIDEPYCDIIHESFEHDTRDSQALAANLQPTSMLFNIEPTLLASSLTDTCADSFTTPEAAPL
jgi:hypothetical protein